MTNSNDVNTTNVAKTAVEKLIIAVLYGGKRLLCEEAQHHVTLALKAKVEDRFDDSITHINAALGIQFLRDTFEYCADMSTYHCVVYEGLDKFKSNPE